MSTGTTKCGFCCTVLLFCTLCAATLSAQTPDYNQKPPPSTDDVAAGIFTAIGLNVDGLLVLAEADTKTNHWEYLLYLDAKGRPVTSDASTKRYVLEINLSYMRDGSGGYCWHCVMLVTDLKSKLYTNGGSNDLSSEEWDELMDGRASWDAFNDPETVRKFDATLARNVLDAVKDALGDLNDGVTGVIRTNAPKRQKNNKESKK